MVGCPPRSGGLLSTTRYAGLLREWPDLVELRCGDRAAGDGHASPAATWQTYAHLWPEASDRTRKASGELFDRSLKSPADPLRTERPSFDL